MNHIELGNWGENHALNHLKSLGYEILIQNYRYHRYELDIVALHNKELVVIEVKTRQTDELGPPWMAVNYKKQRQIILAADNYVKFYKRTEDVRFDIISIVHTSWKTDLEHIVDAFSA